MSSLTRYSGTTKTYISEFTAKLEVKISWIKVIMTLTLHPENKLALDICGKVELNADVVETDFIGAVRLTNPFSPLEIDMKNVIHDITWFNDEEDLRIELEAPIDNANAGFDFEDFPDGSIWIDPTGKQEMMIIFTNPYNPYEKELTTIDISEKYYDTIKKQKRLLDRNVLLKMIELKMVNDLKDEFTDIQKQYMNDHPLEYELIEEAMDSGLFATGDQILEDFVPVNIKLDDVNRLAKKFLLNLSNNKDGTNQLSDFLKDIFWSESTDFTGDLQSKLKPLFIPDELDDIDELTFAVKELVNDNCRALEIKNYNPPTLDDAKEIKSNVVDYIFEEEFKTFTIRYFREFKEAKVMKIECFNEKTGGKCKKFEVSTDKMIEGHWTPSLVQIDMVFLADAKGAGHCTHAVGYMLKVLLKESEKLHEYPYTGKVYISSSNPCAAVNCYSHAFMINGFVPDSTEIAEFNEKSKQISENDGAIFDFTFYYFTSESQKKKMAAYKQKLMEKQRNAETGEYQKQEKQEKQDFLPQLKF